MSVPFHLELIHEVPGRMRVRFPGLRHDPGLAAMVENMARTLPGFDGISIRPAAESVVFRYSLEDTNPAAFRSALETRAELAVSPEVAAAAGGPVGARLIREVRSWWLEADRQTLRATQGTVDLRTSVPWVMLFLALRQLAVNGNLPALPWYTALYYSVQAILRYGEDGETQPLPDSQGTATKQDEASTADRG